MNKNFTIFIIILLLIIPRTLLSADMVGYLLNQAVIEYNDKNYKNAYKSLTNIAPTGNPIAIYLLAKMHLNGLGIEKNNKIAHDLMLEASNKLIKHDKALAIEAQLTLSNMFTKGLGVDKDYFKAYLWAILARITSEKKSVVDVIELKKILSPNEIEAAEIKAIELHSKMIKE